MFYQQVFHIISCSLVYISNNRNNGISLRFIVLFPGYHEYGFHVFTLNSSVFNKTVQDMSLE